MLQPRELSSRPESARGTLNAEAVCHVSPSRLTWSCDLAHLTFLCDRRIREQSKNAFIVELLLRILKCTKLSNLYSALGDFIVTKEETGCYVLAFKKRGQAVTTNLSCNCKILYKPLGVPEGFPLYAYSGI